VLAVATFRGFAYTSGDCSVRAWDVRALAPGGPDGNVPDAVTCRDTCDIACLLECDQALYCASANGALRQWSLPHDPTKAQFRAQMWLHNKVVNGAAHWHFGGESVLFTVCDDRECRAWNLRDNQCAHTIVPVDRTGGTLRSVAVSDQYLFLGSSNGQIFVYLTACGCRRTARHECVLPPGPSPFCLQATLRHGDRGTAAANPPVVSSLAVGGQHRQANRLFSGGHDGEVWVWSVPGEGNDFQLLQRLKGVHCGAVTAMVCGWSHLLTGGGDGCVRAFALYSLGWGRGGVQALERVQKVSGRVTCLHLDGSGDVEPDVDLLYVGTNRGQLVVFRLGAYI
jgi:WD40 repeat protein